MRFYWDVPDRKLGSMVRINGKWVISPTFKWGIPWGEITY